MSDEDKKGGKQGIDIASIDFGIKDKRISDALESIKGLGGISEAVSRQLSAIEKIQTPRMPLHTMPNLPPNPIHETNDRLAQIEKQFEEMQQIAANGAEIATKLQGYAAQFLEKFETAANQTQNSATTAIRVSLVAIIISVVIGSGGILYDVIFRAPSETATAITSLSAVAELRQEIEALRMANEQLSTILRESANRSLDALIQIDETLSALHQDQADAEQGDLTGDF